jgi:hypothetical protein
MTVCPLMMNYWTYSRKLQRPRILKTNTEIKLKYYLLNFFILMSIKMLSLEIMITITMRKIKKITMR